MSSSSSSYEEFFESPQKPAKGRTGASVRPKITWLPLIRSLFSSLAQVRDIVVTTDCSGLEAPVLALKALGLRIKFISSSEISPQAQRFAELAKVTAEHRFEDIRVAVWGIARCFACGDRCSMPMEKPDVYALGPPCQALSCLGKNRWVSNAKTIVDGKMADCVDGFVAKVAATRPRLIIFENVDGVSKQKRKVGGADEYDEKTPLELIRDKVEAKVPNEYVFDFYFGDASDLSGSPRPRSFLLGVEKGDLGAIGAFSMLVRAKGIMENIVANVRVETTEELLAMVNDELRAKQLDRKDLSALSQINYLFFAFAIVGLWSGGGGCNGEAGRCLI